tara:strand:+ start:1201 stop:2055 length:855 start_codon:yes stop_codon:yes gene_type:complete
MEKVKPDNPQSDLYDPSLRVDNMKNIDDFKPSSVPLGFFMLVVAPRRNGKSEKVSSLLEAFNKNPETKFSHIFLFSQTNAGFDNQIPQTYRFRDLEHLPYIVNKQAEVKQYNLKQKDPKKRIKSRILIVLDDVIGEEKGSNSLRNNGMIRKLAVNGRHLQDNVKGNSINVMLVVQAVKSIPKTIRLQTDIIAVGRISNRVERQTIIEEFTTLKSTREGLREAYDLFDTITLSRPFRFMIVSNHRPNKKTSRDFINYYDGDYPVKQHRLFGDEYDWSAEAPPMIF